ncbi:MAG: pyridoxal 5'-phosphate synthase glutaminase subunit PdxT [Calditrichia bacterium]|nr:pyridoxal 5'-phosphate synthase glutaminase subunit PdxT [Calditrichia bacterium]
MVVGVLGIQGGFSKHKEMIDSMGYDTKIIRTPDELKKTDALIIPGGESTTFLNLFDKLDLEDAIKEYSINSPIMGTCAGMIVLATKVDSINYSPLGLINIEVNRNAYGRQKESFVDKVNIELNNRLIKFEAVFIRAPKIVNYGSDCDVLAKYKDDNIMVQNNSVLVCSFHPELTGNNVIHKYFLEKFM